jgi:hypothetical protein
MRHAAKERLGDEIAELAAHLDAATHRFLSLIARFDESGGWADQGALTCAHWLCWRVGLELGAAREHVRVAKALRELPRIDDALRLGQISYSKVRALTRVASAENEAELLAMAGASTASQLERICRGYRRVLRHASELRPEDEAELRWVRQRETETGFVRFDIQLRPDEAAILTRALQAASSRAWTDEKVSAGTSSASLRRADALVAVAESYLSGQHDSAPPVEVVVHVEASDGAGTLDDGTALSRETTERLTCDAAIVTVREDSRGNVVDVGRRRRSIPTMLRRALRLRDRGCRFPGCTNRLVDAHHVTPWARGGSTTLANLCSLCRRHHTFVHEHGFRIECGEAGNWKFLRPDGREVATSGVPVGFWLDPIEALRRRAREDGIAIDPTTNESRWDGRPVDYGLVVWSMMPADG